jgi:hypothetical protein
MAFQNGCCTYRKSFVDVRALSSVTVGEEDSLGVFIDVEAVSTIAAAPK